MTLILVRHGESQWNKKNLFCGWVDVNLGPNAMKDNKCCANLIGKYFDESKPFSGITGNSNIPIDKCYTSVLKRSILSAHSILESANLSHIEMTKSWRLNERFYGGLTGEDKHKMVMKYTKEKIQEWRRSYKNPPPKIDQRNRYNPYFDKKYHHISKISSSDFNLKEDIPETEALWDVIQRAKKIFSQMMVDLKNQKNILCVVHGTSFRALLYLIQTMNYNGDHDSFGKLLQNIEVPNGFPIVYKFNKNGEVIIGKDVIKQKTLCQATNNIPMSKINGLFLGNIQQLINAQQKVKNQVEIKNPEKILNRS